MRDGRPNPDIWGNIITCVEIGEGIYCIFGKDKKGIEMPKEVADELFPESVLITGKEEADGNFQMLLLLIFWKRKDLLKRIKTFRC